MYEIATLMIDSCTVNLETVFIKILCLVRAGNIGRRKKNLKQGNLMKNVGVILLAATMIVTSFPALSAEVRAAELPDGTQFATKEELKAFNTNDSDGIKNSGKVYFGSNNQQWWIAGSQNGNLTLFAASPLKGYEYQQFYASGADNQTYKIDWGCTYPNDAPADVHANHYGASPVRTTLKGLETSYFSESEQKLMNSTVIYTYDEENDSVYSTEDKLYLAYGCEGSDSDENTYITVGTNSTDGADSTVNLDRYLNNGLRIDNCYWGETGNTFWLRAPAVNAIHTATNGNVRVANLTNAGKSVVRGAVIGSNALVPAFALNLSSVLFASDVSAVSHGGNLASDKKEAMTIRYKVEDLGSAVISSDKSKVNVSGITWNKTYLVAQNNEGAWAWPVYSFTESVSAGGDGFDGFTSFENCEVWLERTDTANRMTYATMATMAATEEGYDIKIADNATLNISGDATQKVNAGSAITDITVEAAEGYYLPDNYINDVTAGLPAGFKAVRNGKTVTISGTPQSNATITLPNATEKLNRADTPDVTGGIEAIAGTNDTMEYASSAASATWKSCTNGSTEVGVGTWYVRYKETDTQKASTAKEVTVTAPAYAISVDSNSLTFETTNEGYADVSAKSLKIQNAGNVEVTNLSVVLTGTNAAAFTLDTNGVKTTLAPGTETTVSVKPNKDLGTGTYQAELKITADSGVEKSVPIAFTVEERELPPTHTHSYGTDWKTDSTNHWHECTCGDKADIAAHQLTWIIDKEATADEKGSKHEECEVCGYKEAAVEIPATGSPGSGYEILEGENQTYNGRGGLTVRANGDFSKFTGLKVDGAVVDPSNYDAKEGSTIVTLKENYLSTLSAGDHRMTFVYDDGEVSANFTTANGGTSEPSLEPTNPATGNSNTGSRTDSTTNGATTNGSTIVNGRSPKTGDKTNLSLYLFLFSASGLMIVFCAGRKKMKTHGDRS